MTDKPVAGNLSPGTKPVLLVLASTYPRWPGDPEPGFVHELARRLTDRFRVIVVGPHAPDAKPRETMDGVEVVRYRYAPERWETLVNDGGIVTNLKRARWKLLLVPGFVLGQAWVAWRLMRRERVAVIHAHWIVPQGLTAALLHAMRVNSVPFVITAHGSDLNGLRGRIWGSLKRFALQRAAAVTVVGAPMRKLALSAGCGEEKLFVRPMGVDMVNMFTPDPEHVRSEREILFIGRLVRGKGVDLLLHAMPLVLQRLPDAKLVVVGHGPERKALVELAKLIGVEAAVRFVGPKSHEQLPHLLRSCGVFVAPFAAEEGLGLVMVEAIACGCSVVAGDVPATRDLLGPDADLCLVDPRDSAALSEKIVHALQSPGESMARYRHLRERLLVTFDWGYVAGRYGMMLAALARGERLSGDSSSAAS